MTTHPPALLPTYVTLLGAILSEGTSVPDAAELADDALAEVLKRFPHLAQPQGEPDASG